MNTRSRNLTRKLLEYEGRHTRLRTSPASKGGSTDTAVFDRGKSQAPSPGARVGFVHGVLGRSSEPLFRSTDKDRRPATRVPFHEPDPDRFAKAEALRLKLVGKEKRRLYHVNPRTPEEHEVPADLKGAIRFLMNEYPARVATARSTLPAREPADDRRTALLQCPPEEARLVAVREDRVLYFRKPSDAAKLFGGETKHIENAASQTTKTAYGWVWARVGDSRKRQPPRRKA